MLIILLDEGIKTNSNPLFYNQALCNWKNNFVSIEAQPGRLSYSDYVDMITLSTFHELSFLPFDPYRFVLLLY